MTQTYDASSIKVLSDIEHVRLRPGMYVSSERGIFQLFTEIFDNAVDEAMNGFNTFISVDINYDTNEVKISDRGRGLPQGINKELNKATPIVIFTKLNSGGKYDVQVYKKSGGLHGVGSTVVNALSEWLHLRTWRGSEVFNASFERGLWTSDSKEVGTDKDSGTTIHFHPDMSHKLIGTQNLSDFKEDIEEKLELTAGMLPSLEIIYNGEKVKGKKAGEFVPVSKEPLLDEPLTLELPDLSVALNWSKETNKSVYRAYCNSLSNPNGGDHERGVYKALVEVLGNDDIVFGMNFFVSVFYPEVEYDSQAKLKASSRDMQKFVIDSLVPELKAYFKANPEQKDAIINLAKAKRNELNKRNNKGAVKRDRKTSFLNVLGAASFQDASTKNRADAELYIVEGNSAAGSAAQSRNTSTQGILPLRGKVINAETASVVALLKNAEIGTLVSSIDAGIFEDLNLAKSRYSKIIIMADADEDGKHIAATLIAFFMNAMTELVEKGYVYLALPPLYGTTVNKKFVPINDEDTMKDFLARGHKITRFKGLGEMNPEQLEVACMDPSTRELLQITTTDQCKARVAEILGGNSDVRKKLLQDAGILGQ